MGQYNYAETIWLRGCSLGAVLPLLGGQYVLTSWSHELPVTVEFALGWWARAVGLPHVDIKDIHEFWRSAVSYRERVNPELWHGPELDIRHLLNGSMSLAEQHHDVFRAYS